MAAPAAERKPGAPASSPGSAVAPPARPTAPRPALPPAGMVAARWSYVDERRSHEVHAGLRPASADGKPSFVVKESAFHNERADEVVEQAFPIEAPWEAQLFQWRLECRLAVLGSYWRHDAAHPGWRPLSRPQGLPQLDLREVAVSPYRGRATFHHFHHPALREDKMLVALPDATPHGRRHLLAIATLELAGPEDASIELLHAHLPEGPTRSVIARVHMELRDKGYEKIVWGQDFARAYGRAWSRDAGDAYASVLRSIGEGAFGDRRKPRAPVIDPVYTDYVRALTDPRLLELQAKHLTPEEQEAALAGGDAAIRQLIARKREAASREEQLQLTLVEASLLARDQLRPGQRARVDPEVSALVRRFASYL